MRTRLWLMITVLTLTSPLVSDVIVDISVETDKPIYQFGEEVMISVTAYNPRSDAITLALHLDPTVSYMMDGVFDWKEYHVGLPAIGDVVFEPFQSRTWELTHGAWESQFYPLEIGTHSVVGELIDYGFSEAVEFEVVPEPATILLLGLGGLVLRS